MVLMVNQGEEGHLEKTLVDFCLHLLDPEPSSASYETELLAQDLVTQWSMILNVLVLKPTGKCRATG